MTDTARAGRGSRFPQGAEIVGGTPRQFDAFIKAELKRWPDVMRQSGIKME
jgi:hypothetical protein